MAAALVQSAKGTAATATVNPAFSVAPTSGNLIVLCFATDDYNGTPNTGWTQSTGMEQQTFHGGYIWWRISDGSNPPGGYTIGSATNSAWVMMEFSGIDPTPYDISNGQFNASGTNNYTTPAIVPATGGRLLVAGLNGTAVSGNNEAVTTWLNSFTAVDSIGNLAGGSRDIAAAAYRLVTGNGSTSFSTGVTFGRVQDAKSGLIIAFKEAAAGGGTTLTAAGGSYALTGSSAGLAGKAIAGSGSYTITGTSAGLAGKAIAGAGSYTLTGTDVGFIGPWPDAASTGVEAGITLTAYSGPTTVTTNGTLIENKIIDGGIEISAANCTLRNCRIINASIHGISGSDATGLTVEHCDIIGDGGTGVSTGIVSAGTFRLNDISGFALGMSLTGACTVQDNYIHDLHKDGVDVHYDGIAIFGGGDALIEHNAIYVPLQVDGGATACIFLKDFFGTIDNVTINYNLLRGEPAYTIQIDGQTDDDSETITNVSVTNNVCEEGVFGYFSVDVPGTAFNITGSGNVDYLTGDPVEFPDVGGGGEDVTLTAMPGGYALTGATAALARKAVTAAGSYTLTGTAATFLAGGNFTLFCNPGAYTLTGTDATFPGYDALPPQPQPPSYGYVGHPSGASRGRMIRRRERKREDEDLAPPPLAPSPPDLRPPAPGPKPPDLRPPPPGLMAGITLPPPPRTVLRSAPKPKAQEEDDDDDDAVALLLNLLS